MAQKYPKHRLNTNVVSAIINGENISISAYTQEGRRGNFTIPQVEYAFRVIPKLLELNEKLGFKLENLIGRDCTYLNEANGSVFFHDVTFYQRGNVDVGSLEDKSSLCFDYHNNGFADRVEYQTANLEANLNNLQNFPNHYTVIKNHHRIGSGAFA